MSEGWQVEAAFIGTYLEAHPPPRWPSGRLMNGNFAPRWHHRVTRRDSDGVYREFAVPPDRDLGGVSARVAWLKRETKRNPGGNRRQWANVPFEWTCCRRKEFIRVKYDRDGNLSPEDTAIVKTLAYYHECAA